MIKYLILLSFCLPGLPTLAQSPAESRDTSWKSVYRATPVKINALVHTKLDVQPDFGKQYLYGKAWLTLKPYFYPTGTLQLDAKGMDINNVFLVSKGKNKRLGYTYDGLKMKIQLDRTYSRDELYTIYIEYTAKPNEYAAKGSAAIKDAKGLYFINPLGDDKEKPIQMWTQGETEASSVWFPTIDNTNQKTTQEIAITVPNKFVTLSNGLKISSTPLTNGTRKDVWKMDLPHSPYLFFMGIGEFSIVKDVYKGKEVSYYVEKPFERVARKIFGNTPEMMAFFSATLGVEYPWSKYSQMVARDFVSGAMENTTATLHSEYLQQNARELTDGNQYEDYISHELFHQWFGNLVTAESWSNLTLNESFANYSEVIWREHKYGKDHAAALHYEDMIKYFYSNSADKNLVRFTYRDKEDMFDAVSYNKGGRILHMLRNYVGDEAFFKALNLYLTTYKFKSAEAHQLRIAFEEVTGKDLNWFFDQWYYSSGHPELDITYGYDSLAHQAKVFIKQLQNGKPFILPFAIDVYTTGTKQRHNVWVTNRTDTFSFAATSKPLLINIDADKMLLADKRDLKTLSNYVAQYNLAATYIDRKEAIEYALTRPNRPEARALYLQALNDPYHGIRELVLAGLVNEAPELDRSVVETIEKIATKDPKRTTRAVAIDVLAERYDPAYKARFLSLTSDSSYTLSGAALIALSNLDEQQAINLLPKLNTDNRGRLSKAIEEVAVLTKGDEHFDALSARFDSVSTFEKITEYTWYQRFLGNVQQTANFKKGVDRIVAFREIVAGYDMRYKTRINDQFRRIIAKKQRLRTPANTTDIDEQIAYLQQVIST